MPEDAQQVTEQAQEPQGQLSGEEVRQIVTDAVNGLIESDNAKYDALSQDLRMLGDDIRKVAESEESEDAQSEEVVYVVRLDASQTDTAKAFGRVLCTEGLLVVILLAVLCGLSAFRQLSRGWE